MLSSCVCFSGDESRGLIYFSHVGRGFSQLFSSPAPHSYVLKVKSIERSKPKGVFVKIMMTGGAPRSSQRRLSACAGEKTTLSISAFSGHFL